jgi:hypothetical protein
MARVNSKVERIIMFKEIKSKGILIILYTRVYLQQENMLTTNDICKPERTF